MQRIRLENSYIVFSGGYTNYEIVLVNDGSTDNSYQVCQQLANENARIRVISQINQGVSVARNTGIDKSSSDFIMFVDADDWIESDMLEIMVSAFHNHTTIDIAFCRLDHAITVDAVDRSKDSHRVEIWEKQNVLSNFLHFHKLDGKLCNKLFRKELFEGLRLDTKVFYGEDRQLMYWILKRVKAIASLDETLYHYVPNSESATH